MTNNEEELVLIGRLKSMDSVLFSHLQDIEKFCEGVWKSKLLPWFTNHNPDHSREIIFILDQLLTPLEGGRAFLTKHELFVLLASAYLHDIGMQFLKWEDIPVDKLTEKEYEEVRKKHAELSSEIILKRVANSIDRDDFHLPACIDEEYIAPIAFVCKGHSSEYFVEVIEKFRDGPYTPKGRPLRGELLAALLLIADELDLQCKRVDFKETAMFDLSVHSQVHWYKHHYVDYVEISRNAVKITLRYPSNSDNYEPLVKELIETKLVEQIKRVNPYLREGTEGVLYLDDQVEFKKIIDDDGGKRSLPSDVLTELKRLLGKISPPPLLNPDVTPGSASIPEPTKLFTGMEQKKAEFRDLLAKSNLISVEGLGGIGKTEFVLKCIEQFLPKEKVVWFECLPDSNVDALIGLSGYPEVLKGENKSELAKYSGFIDLIEKDEKTLFLDNFQSITDNSFEELLKFAERRLKKARVILVSREHPSFSVKFVPIELHGLGDEALWYAQRFRDAYYRTLQVSEGDLKDICSTLDGHPLAIELALQLLSYGESPKNIIQRIIRAEDKSRELSDRLLDEVFNHPKSTEEEKEFLLRFSLFRTEIDREGMSSLFDGEGVSSTLYKLIDKKMVSVENGLYRTHPLIREFCYQRLSIKEIAHEKAASYFETRRTDRFDPFLEEEIFYHIFSSKNRGRTADFISDTGDKFILLGYTNPLIEMINKALAQGLDRPEYQLFLGDIATLRGKWDDASRHFEEAFSSKDADGRITAEAYTKFGEILYRKGDVREALKYFEDAHARCKRYGYQKEQGRSANDIGLVFKTFGDLQEAERWLSDGQDVRKAIGDKKGIANSLNNIGMVLQAQGNLPGALQKYKESLKIGEEIGDKSGIATSLNNIGSVLQAQGNLPGALQKYKESLKIGEEIGDKSGIATSLNNIGSVLQDQGNLPGALQKAKESLKICEEIGDKSGIATRLNNIGSVLQAQGNLPGALQKYKESLKIEEEIGYKSGIATGLNNIGMVLQAQGNLPGALQKYKESLKIEEEIGYKSGIATRLNNIGSVLQAQGNLPGALQKYKESLKIEEEIGYKSGIATSLSNIGSVLNAQGNLPGALQKYKESLKIGEEIGDKSGIATSLSNIGSVLNAQGNLPGALQKYKESLKIGEEIGDKSGIATRLNNIGSVLQAQGNLPGALQKYKESLKICEEIGNKSGIAISLNNIGEIWRSKKNYPTALECFLKSFALRDRIGVDKNQTAGSISQIRKELGLKKFREKFQDVYDSLAKDLQSHVHLEEFAEDKTVVRGSDKVGRNDPCPCGSGKKYKKCCGK